MSNRRKYTSCRLPKPALKLWHDFVRPGLPDWSFITIHYLYLLLVCFVASLMFWGSSTPQRAISYTDSLFLVISAMTEAGLNTVNLSQLNTFQQVVLFLLIIFGSAIWVSIATVHIRKRAFEQKLQELADKRKTKLSLSRSFHISLSKTRRDSSDLREAAVASGAVRGRAITNSNGSRRDNTNTNPSDRITFAPLDEEMAPVEHAGMGQCGEPENPTTGQDELKSLPVNGDLSFENCATDRENKPEVRLRIVDPPTLPEKVQFVGSPHPSTHNVGPNNSTPFRRSNTRIFSGGGVGARLDLNNHPRNAIQQFAGLIPIRDKGKRPEKVGGSFVIPEKYLKNFNGLTGRNSQFHGLTEKERRQLGGLEYDALALLSYLVPLYFFLFQLLGAIGMGAWMQVNRPYIALQNGLHPFWTGSFFAISAFNNCGMALLDANATALQTSYYSLLTLGFLILAGNTCFPPFLRLIIWTSKACIPRSWDDSRWVQTRQVLQFLLDHPRRCYTHLFPSAQTWWLVGTLVVLNGIDWVAFEILSLRNPSINSIPPNFRSLIGLFQALAVRGGGFYAVNVSKLPPGLLTLYIYMMYLSALPVTLTLRNTNIYEERSLGIFAEEIDNAQSSAAPSRQQYQDSPSTNLASTLKRRLTGQTKSDPTTTTTWSRSDFLRQQLRGQLSHDLWWIALAILLITIIETAKIERDPLNFSVFNIIFECVSAYGCVGISIGVPWNAYSFCGAWRTGSKLVLCAVMLRGRHRGLPVAIDRAVLVPHETLGWAEEEDAAMRARTKAAATTKTETGVGNGTEE